MREANHSGADRQLWVAVIRQAIEDATGSAATITSPNARSRARTEARTWLTEPSEDFDYVCALAGDLDPATVRAFATKIIAEADERQARGEGRATTITHAGRTQSVKAWSEETGIDEATIRFRLKRGFAAEAILTPPSAKRTRKRLRTAIIQHQAA